jgi:hypothetical protein
MTKQEAKQSERNLRGVQVVAGIGLVLGLVLIIAGERIGNNEKRNSSSTSSPPNANSTTSSR